MAKAKRTDNSTRFALRLIPSVRAGIDKFSATEGVSINQFINIAVAERVERLRQREWAASRVPVDDAARADAIALLRRGGKNPPEFGDEIPEEYLAWKRKKGAANVAKPETKVRAARR